MIGGRLDYSATSLKSEESKLDDDTVSELGEDEESIRWINIIFLPFQLWWQIIILFAVFMKCFMGPLTAIYPILHCPPETEDNYYFYLEFACRYIIDPLYIIDTFLYIVHRQVTDEAMKREHLPKPGYQIILDVFSLIPLYTMFADDLCATNRLWPNLLNFNEFVLIYRVAKIFSLNTSHNYGSLLVGYSVMFILVINALTCLFILYTFHGLCGPCGDFSIFGWIDWRKGKQTLIARAKYKDFALYISGFCFVTGLITNSIFDEYRPLSYQEIVLFTALLILGFIFLTFIIMPKLFCESLLRSMRLHSFQPRIKRIIEETRRRNPSPSAYLKVESFYSLIWTKRHGIITMPKTINDLPETLILDIRQDLVWPVFHHSPTFRKSTLSYKRWLCQHVSLGYKQPGERFFTGPHCYSNLYYIKAGIVQLLSSDDTTSPLLSVSGGTLFGDLSFLVPPMNRKVIARCLTYCEVLSIARADIVTSLHKFPEDRRIIMRLCREKLQHAHDLYDKKGKRKGLDRTEDEGVAWVKRRWWEIFNAVNKWKFASSKCKRKWNLPAEESNYHCAKYLGQLVLCEDIKLQRKSLFVRVTFPWIFAPLSKLLHFWRRVVFVTVALVLFILPPNIIREVIDAPTWYKYFLNLIDIIYIADVVINLLTGIEVNKKIETRFISLLVNRCNNKYFIMDVLSTRFIEYFVSLTKNELIIYFSKFNRLIKAYVLFVDKHERTWNVNEDPLKRVFYVIILIQFCYYYIPSFFFYIPVIRFNLLEEKVFYGNLCIFKKTCINTAHDTFGIFAILIGWMVQGAKILNLDTDVHYNNLVLGNLISLTNILVHLIMRFKLISSLYLKYRERINYQFFVTNLKNHYIRLKIHPDLLKRLDNYLDCHWRYYNGMDILHPNLLKDEPFDIYWKLHGDTAEKIIGESPAFLGADSALIKELAHKSKFLILPQNSTLIMFGVEIENVTWIASGVIKCEYHDDEGETRKLYLSKGSMLETPAVFLGRPPLRTYSSASDVEVLYIKVQEFFTIIRRYPVQWSYFQTCEEELGPTYDTMFISHVKKHKDYQKTLRQRVFHARQSVTNVTASKKKIFKDMPVIQNIRIPEFFKDFRTNPESKLFRYWMAFRAIIFVISMIASTLAGASLHGIHEPMAALRNVCNVIRIMDMVIKLFVPYYDNRGLVISKITKCALHYLTRSFIVDLISIIFGWPGVVSQIFSFDREQLNRIMQTGAEYLSIYLFIGYLNYVADKPSSYVILIMLMKWQLIIMLNALSFGCLLLHYCINMDSEGNLLSENLTSCWLPIYTTDAKEYVAVDWHLVFTEGIALAQCMFMGTYLGKFDSRYQVEAVIMFHLMAAACFGFFNCFSQTLLILAYRGDSVVHNGINQLKIFLTGERVEKHIIHKAMDYFSYWWKRSAGLDMRILMNERVGVVFRQDMCYYFFKRTFQAVDTLLHGGEALERQLASCTSELYQLPGEDIVREMDLCSYLFIVHRGKISISKNNVQIAVLTKGSIFGQLDGANMRPIRITARAVDRADLLVIPLREFQQMITNEVRKHISNNPQSKQDYMGLKKALPENPYNSIEYLLRGSKVIKLPWMYEPESAETNKWYARWLLLVWAVGPILTAVISLLLGSLIFINLNMYTLLVAALDLLHVAYIYTEFYTMELDVVDARCQYKYIRLKKFKSPWIYLDVLSVVLPYLTLVNMNWRINYGQLTRLIRLYTVYFFYADFCSKFEGKTKSSILKVVLCVLVFHALVCGWIHIACMKTADTYSLKYLPYQSRKLHVLDLSEWDYVFKSRKRGCARIIYRRNYTNPDGTPLSLTPFISPTHWEADYLLAFHFIIILFTSTNIDTVVPITIVEIYYKIFAWHLLYLLRLWISSVVISTVYTKYHKMYHFDYAVNSLLKFLKYSDISLYLRQSIQTYTDLLWKRQSGNWLPEITDQAPFCLREDILSSLYIHHLLTPMLFQNLPMYFLRQLTVKLKRVVIFPGKYIVEEGDIHPCIYFIHEGEVEKWFTDRNGESRMSAVLTINGVFGLIPGLFPNTPYQFSYYSRTMICSVTVRKIRQLTDVPTARLVYFSYFHSVMSYCIFLWDHAADIDTLQRARRLPLSYIVLLSRLITRRRRGTITILSVKPYSASFFRPARAILTISHVATVADLVYLEYYDWQDLLNGYPDVKYDLYIAAMKMRKETSKSSLRTPSKTSLKSTSKISL